MVLNKIDMLPLQEQAEACEKFAQALGWKENYFMISALTGEGCKQLTYAIMEYLEQNVLTPEQLASAVNTEATLDNLNQGDDVC